MAKAKTMLFAGWPDKTVDAGELGIIQFDANGAAQASQAQADWLAAQIAAGALPEPEGAPQGTGETNGDLVAMVRDEPPFLGGPVKANVHKNEVAGYLAAGWVIAHD